VVANREAVQLTGMRRDIRKSRPDFVVAVYFSSKEKATKSEAQNVGKVDAFTVDTSDCPSRAANAQGKFAFSR
jgi:hypothetical protein